MLLKIVALIIHEVVSEYRKLEIAKIIDESVGGFSTDFPKEYPADPTAKIKIGFGLPVSAQETDS